MHCHTIGTTGMGAAWHNATQQMRFHYSGGTYLMPSTGGSCKSNNGPWMSL